MIELLDYFLITFVALFVIINPLTTAFVFQNLLPYSTHDLKYQIAKRAALIAGTILIIFSLFGNFIFQIFGITIPAFKIAGGLILFGIAMNMIKKQEGEHDEKHHTSTELDSDDISVVPLAIPFISGPGSIATTMLLTSESQSRPEYLIVIISIILVVTLCYFTMKHSHKIVEKIGVTGKKISTKIFGLILAVISIQFVLNGAFDLLPEIAQFFK